MGETQTTVADEAQPEKPEPQPAEATSWSLSLPVMSLIVRFITLVFLVLTIALLASDSATIPAYNTDGDGDGDGDADPITIPIPAFNTTLTLNSTTFPALNTAPTLHFNDIYAYRYALSAAVIGLSYTFLLLILSIQLLRTGGKSPMNHPKLPFYEFLGDKVVLALLATGVGAAFGATVDLKASVDQLDNALQLYLGLDDFAPIFSKLIDFFDRAYFPAIFLLMAFLTSGVSSLLSSLALINNKPLN